MLMQQQSRILSKKSIFIILFSDFCLSFHFTAIGALFLLGVFISPLDVLPLVLGF